MFFTIWVGLLMVSCVALGVAITTSFVQAALIHDQWERDAVIEHAVDEDVLTLSLYWTLVGSLELISICLAGIYYDRGGVPLHTSIPALLGLAILYGGRWRARYAWYLKKLGSEELYEKLRTLHAQYPANRQPREIRRKLAAIESVMVERELIPGDH